MSDSAEMKNLTKSRFTKLTQSAKRIAAANDKFRLSFHDWIRVVGDELRKAQKLLSVNKSHDSEFSEWVSDNFGWTRQRAHQLMKAEETMRLMSTIVDMRSLPSTESQCRPLTALPPDDQREVWSSVLENARISSEGTKLITAKLVNSTVKDFLVKDFLGNGDPNDLCEPDKFDVGKASDDLCGWLRDELGRLPPEHQQEAVQWIRAILKDVLAIEPTKDHPLDVRFDCHFEPAAHRIHQILGDEFGAPS